jgi:hypothetical protein
MAIQVETQLPPGIDIHHNFGHVPMNPKVFADIINMVASGRNATEIKDAVRQVRDMPVPSLYDLIADHWKKERSIIDPLLEWGDMEHKFKLLNLAAEKVKEEQKENNIPLEILNLSPKLVSHKSSHTLRPTVLHIAAFFESNELVSRAFTCALHPGVEGFEATFDVKQKRRNIGKTPLALAVENDMECMVRKILELSDRPLSVLLGDSAESQGLLVWALKDATPEILKALIELRPSNMTEDVPRRALEGNNLELIKTLQDSEKCHHLFQNHGFLHSAVQEGKIEVIEVLLAKFPKMALELDTQNKPALSYNSTHGSNVKKAIRNVIVPYIIRLISSEELEQYQSLLTGNVPSAQEEKPRVSEVVRALLADPSGTHSLPASFSSCMFHELTMLTLIR